MVVIPEGNLRLAFVFLVVIPEGNLLFNAKLETGNSKLKAQTKGGSYEPPLSARCSMQPSIRFLSLLKFTAILSPFMKRPIGLILTTIVLGLIALCNLFSAAIMLFAAVIGRHAPLATTATPSAPPVAANFLLLFSIGTSLFMALLATWAIFTIVGLLRLRNWGRISVLIIGGCLAATCGLAAAGLVISLIVSSTWNQPGNLPPNLPPHFAAFMFASIAFFYACLAAIGIWWLVYFNRRKVKAFFVSPAVNAYSQPTPYSYPIDSTYTAPQLIKPGRFANVPVGIVILACFFLLSSLMCVVMAFVPFPAFLLGFIISGPAKYALYVAFAACSGFIGYGLLHLDNRARIATLAFLGFGVVNTASILLPRGRSQFLLYNEQMMQRFQVPGVPTTPMPGLTYASLIVGSLTGLAFTGFLMWLLQRHSDAFLRTPPPPEIS